MDFNKLTECHLFEQLGQKMLYDVERLNFYRIDDISFQILTEARENNSISENMVDKWKINYGSEVIEQIINDFRQLGLFNTALPEQNDNTRRKPQWSSLCLDVTHQCNLSCRYCYAPKEMEPGESKHMSYIAAERAMGILNESNEWNIRFNGGEPLLNLPVIYKSLDYIKERATKENKNIKFQIITNGLLLKKEIAEFCRDNDISLTISFDGDPSVQDKARLTIKGDPSHDGVISNIINLKDINIPFGINVVLGPHQKNIVDTILYLQKLEPKSIGIMPADAAPPGWNTVRENPEFIENQWRNLTMAWVEWRKQGPTLIDSLFEIEILTLLKREKRYFACEAGVTYLAAGPDGAMYPCHLLVGCKEMAREQDQAEWPDFESRDVRNITACRKCWARYICGGGCPGANYRATGKINQPDPSQCRITKTMAELSMTAFSMLPEAPRKHMAAKAKRDLKSKGILHG